MSFDKVKTKEDMSLSSPAHQAAKGNYTSWHNNVADHLKGKPEDEVRAYIKQNAHKFAVCFEHWIGDFNMGTGIRNANAFGAQEVFYIGEKKWDKRAAVGVYNYTEVQWISTKDQLLKLKERYAFVAIDNVPGSRSIHTYRWPENALMVFGEEGAGITPEMLELCDDVVEIPMYGSVRSLNCGTASGIVMFDYVRKLRGY